MEVFPNGFCKVAPCLLESPENFLQDTKYFLTKLQAPNLYIGRNFIENDVFDKDIQNQFILGKRQSLNSNANADAEKSMLRFPNIKKRIFRNLDEDECRYLFSADSKLIFRLFSTTVINRSSYFTH